MTLNLKFFLVTFLLEKILEMSIFSFIPLIIEKKTANSWDEFAM